MRKISTYILLAVSIIALASSCRRESLFFDDGSLIKFTAETGTGTKAFIGRNDLARTGTTVKVYDYLTGFPGTFNGQTGDLMYINGEDVVCDGSDWAFESGNLWQWTRSGVHNFFGYLAEDCSSNPALTATSLWNNTNDASFDATSRTFTVPTLELNASSSQFDLCYSRWIPIDASSRTSDNVVLPLQHAFMALAIRIDNNSEDKVNLMSVTLDGFKNIKSSTYSYGDTDVTYGNQSSSNFLATWTGTKRLVKGDKIDLYTGGTATPSSPNYIMMWPQVADEVEHTKIVLEYTIDNVYDETDPTQYKIFHKELSLKASGLTDVGGEAKPMMAGTKYNLVIQFKGKTLDLTLETLPWVMDYTDVSYSTSAILANSSRANEGVLWMYNASNYDPVTDTWQWIAAPRSREITLTNNMVQGRFYIEAPTSGQWQITTYPEEAAQYFTVEPSSGTIDDLVDGAGAFTGYVEFLVKGVGAPSTTQVLHFNVDILINGIWRNANTEFNRKDWKLTREP